MSTYVTLGPLAVNSGSGTSLNYVLSTAVNPGDLVVMRYGNDATARPAGLACTDQTGGTTNVFAIATDAANASGAYTCLFWCVATSAIAAGGTIRVSTTASFSFIALSGIKCTNPAGSTPLDAPATKSASGNSGTASSGTTASPTTSDWVAVFCVDSASASNFTQQAGWTEDNDDAIGFETQTKIGTNTTAIAGSSTQLSGPWACSCAVFRLGGASTPVSLSATSSTSATVRGLPGKSLVASSATTGTLVRMASRKLSATGTTSATAAGSKAFLRTLTATYNAATLLGLSLSFQVLPGRNMTATSSTTATLRTGGVVSLSASSATSAKLGRVAGRTIRAASSTSAVLTTGGSRTASLAVTVASVAHLIAGKGFLLPRAVLAKFTTGGQPTIKTSGGQNTLHTRGGQPNSTTQGPTG